MDNYRQFKLSNGDEIVCEIVEYEHEETGGIVVRNCFQITSLEDASGSRYHSFKPWMVYQSKPNLLQIINPDHVVGESIPDDRIISHYAHIISEYEEEAEQETEEDVLNREEIIKRLQSVYQKLTDHIGDSDNLNIIKFNPRKIH